MSKHNELTLKEAINKMLTTYQLKGRLNEAHVVNKWEEIVGKTIAKYTKNVYIKDKKLFIKIDSAPLKQELHFQKEQLIKLINEEVGEQVIVDVLIY